mgnify:CR=1 FL=1
MATPTTDTERLGASGSWDSVYREERRVITFVERNLTSILPANFNLQNRLFLVSGRTALLYRRKQNGEVLKPKYEAEIPANFEETGFIEFETALGNFLSNDKGAVKLNRYIRDVKKIFASNL